jgi:hypothetical protein
MDYLSYVTSAAGRANPTNTASSDARRVMRNRRVIRNDLCDDTAEILSTTSGRDQIRHGPARRGRRTT